MSARRVALLDLQARPDAFLADGAFAALASRLEARGHAVRQLRSVMGADARGPVAWRGAVASWLASAPCDVAVVARAWDGALLDALRAALPAGALLVRHTPGVAAALDDRFDHVLDEPGLLALLDGAAAPPRATYTPTTARALRALPRAPVAVVPAAGARPAISGPAWGCPFLLDATKNPVFQGVALDPDTVQTRGCTFCLDNTGAYAAPREEDVVASWLAQWTAIRTVDPAAREVLLTDERPHPFLPAFFEALTVAPHLWGIELLVKSRVDWLLEFSETHLARALALAAETASVLHVYLVGFENFDPWHLALFNKGSTVEDNAAAVAKLRDLAARFPGSFEHERYRAHGVVLFTPWTAPEALLENARWMRALDFHTLRAEAVRTRLRLYPRTPLHALAARDGLLADRFDAGRDDRAAEQGYDASAPWRFRDARTEAVFRAATALAREDRGLTDADALEAATRFVLRWPGLARAPEGAWPALREALRAWGPLDAEARASLGPVGMGYDLELEALRAGRRRACLKENVPRADAPALVAAYEAMGWRAAVVAWHGVAAGPDAHRAGDTHALVAVARDAATLDEALALQRAHAAGDLAVVRAMGALVGYPACCVEAFAALPDRGDNGANERAPFRRAPAEALHPLANRLGRARLASHHLCAPACAATVALARARLDDLAALDPRAAAWVEAELRRPVLFLDYARRAALRGRWEADAFRVDEALALDARRDLGAALDDLAAVTLAPDGATLTARDGRAHRVACPAPLLVVPGEPLAPPARDALAPPAVAPPPLPTAFRVGVRAGAFAVHAIERDAAAHRVVLARDAERVVVRVRAHDPARAATVRVGRWAVDVDDAAALSDGARAAVGALVRALPR